MKSSIFSALLKDIFNEFIWKRVKSADSMVLVFILAFGLNIVSMIFSLKSIEILRSFIKTQENVGLKIYNYVINTVVVLVTKYLSEILASLYVEKVSRGNMVLFLKSRMEMKYSDMIKSDSAEAVSILQTKLNAYKSIFEITMLKGVSMLIFIVSFVGKIEAGNYFIVYVFSMIYPVLYITVSLSKLTPIMDTHRRLISEKKLNSSLLYDKIQNYEVVKCFGIERQQADDVFHKTGPVKNLMFQTKFEFRKRSFIVQILSEAPLFILCILNKIAPELDIQNIGLTYMIFKNLNTILGDVSTLTRNLLLSLNSLEERDINVVNQGKEMNIPFEDKITFRAVSILHDNKPIIKDIDLNIKKYDRVAVIGDNGTGKSTFVRSMLNFSDYSGEILIDRQCIKECLPSDLFKLFSYVSQDDYISNGSVLDNIRIGNKNATMEEIEQASKKIGLHDEILQMKNGYETNLGPDGNNISPGQKKKISLLRAFVKNSPILVLDEATSTLDKKYEDFFVKEILNNIRDKTIFTIIHKKDLIKYFDKVIFLKDGSVNDFGRYEDMYKRNTCFRQFVEEGIKIK